MDTVVKKNVELFVDDEEEDEPKDNNERVERLLKKLAQNCKLLKV